MFSSDKVQDSSTFFGASSGQVASISRVKVILKFEEWISCLQKHLYCHLKKSVTGCDSFAKWTDINKDGNYNHPYITPSVPFFFVIDKYFQSNRASKQLLKYIKIIHW